MRDDKSQFAIISSASNLLGFPGFSRSSLISKFEECDTNLELPGSRPDLCVFIRMQKHSARAWLRNIFLLVQNSSVSASDTQHRCYQSLPNLGMNIMTVLCQVRPKSIWSFAPYFGVGIVAHCPLQSTTSTCGTTIRGLPRHRDGIYCCLWRGNFGWSPRTYAGSPQRGQ